jgi:hypothetical protein
MANESSALVLRPGPGGPNEGDYHTICDALSESARGRWFLTEYARRNRSADTKVLLAALDRIEARLNTDATTLARFRDELRMLLMTIRLGRPGIAAAAPSGQAAKLARLIDVLERRIDALIEGKPAPLDEPIQSERGYLKLVPPPDEREAPDVPEFDSAPPETPPQPAKLEPPPRAPAPPEPISDPLAAIMALSEVERIALFT